ncbi:hypothetical protein ACQEU3_43100 [Spirillospora sp. CA-253888]
MRRVTGQCAESEYRRRADRLAAEHGFGGPSDLRLTADDDFVPRAVPWLPAILTVVAGPAMSEIEPLGTTLLAIGGLAVGFLLRGLVIMLRIEPSLSGQLFCYPGGIVQLLEDEPAPQALSWSPVEWVPATFCESEGAPDMDGLMFRGRDATLLTAKRYPESALERTARAVESTIIVPLADDYRGGRTLDLR